MKNTSRRQFLKAAGLSAGALALSTTPLAQLQSSPLQADKKLGIALVGLGGYSSYKLAPAFKETEHCYLAGIVTGTPSKAEKWMKEHNIPKTNVYNYQNFDRIKDNPAIDIIYVVLPNGMHAEYTIRAAEAGKHVICEKPMAISVAEGEAMVAACKKAGVLLQIGYRVHYDPYTQELKRVGQNRVLGQIKTIQTGNAFYASGFSNWRYNDKALSGGGALMDMGVYCVQGCRYTTGEEPVAVMAQAFNTRPDGIIDVEETMLWHMEFPSGAVASCMTGYGARSDFIKVSAVDGNFGLEPGYGYGLPQGHVKGAAMDYPHINQQAAQMDAFAKNIMEGTPVIASGEMGVLDMKVIEAIYKSAKNGRRVKVGA